MQITYVYLYETRKLDFLDLLLSNLESQGFIPVVLSEKDTEHSVEYRSFLSNYQHFSDNPYNFEVSCFARYFAILEKHKDNDLPFIIADSDIFVSQTLFNDLTYIDNFFYGSAGFDNKGEECQISPHFSFWTYPLLKKFVTYICEFYKANKNTSYIREYYEEKQKRLGRTGISDMTLLYDWVTNDHIPFVNTNTVKTNILIDHNISSFNSGDGIFLQFLGRKKILLRKNKAFLAYRDENNNYATKEVCVLHFQGRYKKTLAAFYQRKYFYFLLYSAFMWTGRNVRSLMAKFKV